MGIVWETTNLGKDERAIELAKVELGWDVLTPAQRMDSARALIIRAQQIKGATWHGTR
jgi:hypothetical protein